MPRPGSAKGEPGLTQADYQVLARFRGLLRRFLAFSADAAGESGLTPQQHQALLAIKGHPDGIALSVGELADQLAIRPNSAVGLVDRLVAAGLVQRFADREDRRGVKIDLTEKAEHILEALSAAHRQELRQLAPLLLPLLRQLEK